MVEAERLRESAGSAHDRARVSRVGDDEVLAHDDGDDGGAPGVDGVFGQVANLNFDENKIKNILRT